MKISNKQQLAREQLESKFHYFLPLLTLMEERQVYKKRNVLKILKTTQDRYNLIMTGNYANLEKDEMMHMTANIICHYFLKDVRS